MWSLEQGEFNPSAPLLVKLSKALGVSIEELVEEPVVPLDESPSAGTKVWHQPLGEGDEEVLSPTLWHDYDGPFWRRYDAEWDKHMSEIVAAFKAAERGEMPAVRALKVAQENLQPALVAAERETMS